MPPHNGPPPEGHGSLEEFESEWAQALETREPRFFAYPEAKPTTQVNLFEAVKAGRIDQWLSALPAGRVLEFGCGSGGMSAYLTNKGYRVVSCDISANAIAVARMNAQSRVDPALADNQSFVRVDAFTLPFSGAAFDIVMSFGVLEHYAEEELERLLKETCRVLRPGGLYVGDIVGGHVSVRTLAAYLNFAASTVFHALKGRWREIAGLRKVYFGLYESSYLPQEWERLLRNQDLADVEVPVANPFPPLALSGPLETAYIRCMRAAAPLWSWFDHSSPPFLRRLGWLYIYRGTRRS